MADQKLYEASNKIETVCLNSFSKKEFHNLLNTNDNIAERNEKAQTLLNYLCYKFKIKPVQIIVHNKPQPHLSNQNGKLKSKIYGSYNNGFSVINIYNLTAKRKQPISIKVFIDTLLHEFIHHYDYEKLNFTNSIHTAGFYKRITDLKQKIS